MLSTFCRRPRMILYLGSHQATGGVRYPHQYLIVASSNAGSRCSIFSSTLNRDNREMTSVISETRIAVLDRSDIVGECDGLLVATSSKARNSTRASCTMLVLGEVRVCDSEAILQAILRRFLISESCRNPGLL
ncbi:hypothetical protein BD309DRAFT_959454 [Dichomitus squalens]|nr:hypothetical protein BD309DRAFT_959454 [Dichomitus squalens]